MTKALICGSRNANEVMLERAKQATLNAIQSGFFIYVGDASGVDEVVIDTVGLYQPIGRYATCYFLGVCRRYRYPYNIAYRKLSSRLFKSYTDRDRAMIESVDMVLCIWNGKSKGTKAVYDYALSIEKLKGKVWLETYD